MTCPQCQAEATKVGNFWVCPKHGQLPEAKPVPRMRIFLSYGHDPNEELVRRIKPDLEKRGHDVWFDKSEIKFGDDWRRAITDGILHSQRVVSFLSKHSTRDPGVCRDEIAIAIGVKGGNIQTILVESEAEVQPPVNIGHIQWLDMHDWKQRKERGLGVPPEHPDSWEAWYQAKLAEIIRVVESDDSRRFAGEIETLHGHLKPIKSDARIYDLLKKGFFGRQWLFEAVEKWRSPQKSEIGNRKSEISSSRLFWITGDPGVGKSAFAAQLTHARSDAVIAAQLVEWDKPDHRDARRVVRSLAFQLATRLPDYRKLLLTLPEIAELDRKDPAELFDYLLANPLRSVISGGRERQLIVIDALDEAGESGRNPLVEMLARHAPHLPDWLGLVVTSRPESAVQTPLQGMNPFVLDTRTETNRADLRDYLQQKLAPQLHDRPDADRLLGQILEKSEGVFLYVERFCNDVQQNHLSLDRPDQFPQGLGGIFCQWFQRQFPDLEKFGRNVRPALRAILAAREPLPVEILQRLFHWQDEELRDFTRTLGSLFPVAKENGCEVVKPYHKSLADWLADDGKAGPYFVSVMEGHRMLADYCWRALLGGVRSEETYQKKFGIDHLEAVGRARLREGQASWQKLPELEWLGLQIARFTEIKPRYELFHHFLDTSFHAFAPQATIQGRVKYWVSFGIVIQKYRPELRDPLCDVIDICGIRVIIRTEEEREAFCKHLEKQYNANPAESVTFRPATTVFPLPRYVIKLKSDSSTSKGLTVKLRKQLDGLHCLVEVCTLREHAQIGAAESQRKPSGGC